MVRWNGHSHFPYLHPIVCHYLVQNGMWTGEGNRVRKRADSSGYRLSSHSLHSFPFLTARAEVREVTLGQEWATCGPMNDQQVIGIKDEFWETIQHFTFHPIDTMEGQGEEQYVKAGNLFSFLIPSSLYFLCFLHSFSFITFIDNREKGRYGRWLVNYCPFTSLYPLLSHPYLPLQSFRAFKACHQSLLLFSFQSFHHYLSHCC